MNKEENIITVELTRYDENKETYYGIYKGKEIEVDPFINGVWDVKLIKYGEVEFEGYWYQYEENVFLPVKEVK